MDAGQITAGLLLLLCIAGVAYFLAQRRSQPQRPVANAGRSEIERDFARVFSRARQRAPDKALDGSERFRPHRSHAARHRRVAAG
jgi:uncharacterized iron-regulated membrane protein